MSNTSAQSVTNTPLSELDPEIAAVLKDELGRQRNTLEMIASELISCPANHRTLLLLGVAATGAELTAIRMETHDNQLNLEVLAWRELLASSTTLSIRDQLAPWPCNLSTTGEPLDLWVLQPCLEPIGQQVAATLGLAEGALRVLPPETVAKGAARFAAMAVHGRLCGDQSYQGTEIKRVETRRLCPRSVGVVGESRTGDQYYWRRLFSGGTPLHTTITSELAAGTRALPTFLVLAETANPFQDPPLWLPQSKWRDFSLQLYALKTIRRRTQTGETGTLRITLRDPAGFLAWNERIVDVMY